MSRNFPDEMTSMVGVRLVSSNSRPIRSLLGFKPSHQAPKNFSQTTNRFARQCAQEDITNEIDLIWSMCRVALQYKRKDMTGPILDEGSASIQMPDFRFNIRTTQDESAPEELLWQQSVDEIKKFDLLINPAFNEIFSKGFDFLEADFSIAPSMDALIDRIEELESTEIRLQYPADCRSCEIQFKHHGITILVTEQNLQLSTNQLGRPSLLAEKFLQIRAAIYGKEKTNLWSHFLSH